MRGAVNPSRRHDLIALAILILIPTILFGDVLIGRQNFYMRDLTRYYYPAKQILREIVQGGEFPYWNRYFSAGQPLAANPEHEVFYPLTWLILLPSYDFGYRLHILIHIYIGLLGMYALLRSMRLRAPAALFGAISFGVGGLYLAYINLLPILFCAAWLPLTCLFVRKFLLKPRLREFALASLFLGLQFIVGEPTTVMQTGLIIGMYALYRGWYAARDAEMGWREAVPQMLSRVAFIALISLGGVAIGAAQMLPAIDHLKESARSRPFEFSLVSAWSMPWAKFAEIIYPNVLGHISIDRVMWYWGGGLYPGMGSPFLFSIYSGLIVIALVAAGFFVRPRGGRFVLILSFLSVLIALGSHTPLLRFLYDHHVATSIRYPEKFAMIAVFAMIVFAAKLFERLLDGDEGVRQAAMGFVLATSIVAAIAAVFTLTPQYAALFGKVWGITGSPARHMVYLTRVDWSIAAMRGGILFAILLCLRSVRREIGIALLFVFLLADLLPVVHQLNPRMPASFFREKPVATRQFPKDLEPFRIFHEADWYGQEDLARHYFSTGDAVYWIVRNGLFPMTPVEHGLRMVMERDYDKTLLLPTLDYLDAIWDVKRTGKTNWWKPFTAMSNAWYRAVYRPFDAEKKRVHGNMKIAQPIEFLPLDHNPRYYFADQLVKIDGKSEFVSLLSKNEYSSHVAFVKFAPFVPAPGRVHGYRETANTARIDAESDGRSFLVMSVTPNKWWHVTVDGREVHPSITNIAFQGIEFPAGRHEVVMRYRNDLAVTGARISIAATLLLLAAAMWPSRTR
jgi:hypothetical protein